MTAPGPVTRSAAEMSARLSGQTLAMMETAAIWLGGRLGWYAALRDHGPLTAVSLAAGTGTDLRCTQEWLAQQAVAGILILEGDDYALPEGHAEALLDHDSAWWAEPLVRQMMAAMIRLPDLEHAYRTGGGLSWAAIGLAKQYPGVSVDGYDLDGAAIGAARRHAAAAGVADRVHFEHADVSEPLAGTGYDAVIAAECLHDLPHPVPVLRMTASLRGHPRRGDPRRRHGGRRGPPGAG